jgi:probable phosphoglycerate mutase
MTGRRRSAFDQAWVALVLILGGFSGAVHADDVHKPVQIWFVRHAQSELNDDAFPHTVPDAGISYPLTERGVQQANALADQLAETPLLDIYASTRLRAIQTADAIAFRRGMTVKLAPEAAEINLDSAPGMSDSRAIFAELTQRWFDAKDLEAHNGNGESFMDLQRRFLPFVRELMNRHADDSGTIVIVSHSATIALMVPMLATNISAKFALTHTVPNGAVVKTELRDGHLYCTDWGAIPAASFNDL